MILHFTGLGDFDHTYVTVVGAEENYAPSHRQSNVTPRDVALWMSVQHKDKKALDIWAKEIASSGTGMAPGKFYSLLDVATPILFEVKVPKRLLIGLCSLVGGRPKPSPCLKLFSFLYPKSQLPATVTLDDNVQTFEV